MSPSDKEQMMATAKFNLGANVKYGGKSFSVFSRSVRFGQVYYTIRRGQEERLVPEEALYGVRGPKPKERGSLNVYRSDKRWYWVFAFARMRCCLQDDEGCENAEDSIDNAVLVLNHMNLPVETLAIDGHSDEVVAEIFRERFE